LKLIILDNNLGLTSYNFIFSYIIIFLIYTYTSYANSLKSNKLRCAFKVNNNNELLINKTSNQTAPLYESGNCITNIYIEREIIGNYSIINYIVSKRFVNVLPNENKLWT
jgi:hypothetical protein